MSFEERLIKEIHEKTRTYNLDNISRTVSYAQFYRRNPEIRWAMLASMVSRNAGYSMCDLKGEWIPRILKKDTRKHLFLTYEKANWLIFQDAFPQLLLYEFCKRIGMPMFGLLKQFAVSSFMVQEWERFWHEKDKKRLCTSLIINEQHVIEMPVIKESFNQHRIFHGFPFFFQDQLHFSTVLFPVLSGNVYGVSVHGFKKVQKRIETGKKLYNILFESKVSEEILEFSSRVVHTGSRHDFEKYVYPRKKRETPFLRLVYPVIHEGEMIVKDWYKKRLKVDVFYEEVEWEEDYCLTDWYKKKQHQLKMFVLMKEYWNEWK